MESKILEIAEWFSRVKAPDLTTKVNEGVEKIMSGTPLEGNRKKLFGFILFSYSMNHGAEVFSLTEELAGTLGVTKEFTDYASDWINHSKNKIINHGK